MEIWKTEWAAKDSGFRGRVRYMQEDSELSLGQAEFEGLDMQLDESSSGQPERQDSIQKRGQEIWL